MVEVIGARLLRDLGARDVRSALSRLATRYSTRSLQITRNSLERAIRHSESNDLVGRNVAALVKTPQGRDGRPSKSFTLEQAKALLAASERTRLHAYVVLSLLVGIRTEEARALRWDHVVTWVDDSAGRQPVTAAGFDPSRAGEDRYAIYVWRSERHGGDTHHRGADPLRPRRQRPPSAAPARMAADLVRVATGHAGAGRALHGGRRRLARCRLLGPAAAGYDADTIAAELREVVRPLAPDAPITMIGHDWGAVFAYC